MIIYDQPAVVRTYNRITADVMAVTTENGDLSFFKHSPEEAAALRKEA